MIQVRSGSRSGRRHQFVVTLCPRARASRRAATCSQFPFFNLYPSARSELQRTVKQPQRRPEADPTPARVVKHHVEPACSQFKGNEK